MVDLSNSGSWEMTEIHEFAQPVLGLVVESQVGWVANSHDGLYRLDLADPATVALTGRFRTRGQAVGVAASGPWVVVADNSLGFDVVDTSELDRIGEYLSDGFPRGIGAADHLVFVADQPAGLIVLDASSPATPTVRGTLSLGRDPITRVIVPQGRSEDQSALAFVAVVSPAAGLQIVDLSDPSAPMIATTVPTGGSPRGVAIWRHQVYVVSESALELFDVSEPTRPVLLLAQAVPDDATQLSVTERYVFLATPDGITVFRRPAR